MAFATLLMSHAAEESAPPLIDFDGTVFLQFGLFLIMFVVLSKFLFKPYLKVRAARERGIGGARAEAKSAEERAQAMMTDYEDKFTRAKQRGAEERIRVRSEGAKREADLLGSARAEATRALDAAKAKVGKDASAARATLDKDASSLAQKMASKIVGREVQS